MTIPIRTKNALTHGLTHGLTALFINKAMRDKLIGLGAMLTRQLRTMDRQVAGKVINGLNIFKEFLHGINLVHCRQKKQRKNFPYSPAKFVLSNYRYKQAGDLG